MLIPSNESTPAVFRPIKVGACTLLHRVVLAPLTRERSTKDNIPQEIMAEYYSQRGSTPGTLLISEATVIAQKAGLWYHVPGIWNNQQIEAWKKITTAVHSKGSFIFLQLWALGRTADVQVLHSANPGYSFVSASDIPSSSTTTSSKNPTTEPRTSDPDMIPLKPRPLTCDEVEEYANLYATAASNAVHLAGFDGVEIHSSYDSLIDQFLQESSNTRTDIYGGSPENRCRFALEVTKAVVNAVGQERTGMRIGPCSSSQVPAYTHLVSQLKLLYPNFAYLHAVRSAKTLDPKSNVDNDASLSSSIDFIRRMWLPRPLITAGKYTRETAILAAENAFKVTGLADYGPDDDSKEGKSGELIAFGKMFLANPDLPVRLEKDVPLNGWDSATFTVSGDTSGRGYTDYPFWEPSQDDAIRRTRSC